MIIVVMLVQKEKDDGVKRRRPQQLLIMSSRRVRPAGPDRREGVYGFWQDTVCLYVCCCVSLCHAKHPLFRRLDSQVSVVLGRRTSVDGTQSSLDGR